MTLRERAEKILGMCDVVYGDDMRDQIESELKAAVDEAFERGRKDVYSGDWAIARTLCRNAALEKAAQVAEAPMSYEEWARNDGSNNIAAKIRALKGGGA